MSEPRFKSSEMTLQEAIYACRISSLKDTEALALLLKSRALDPDFDPLPLPISEITPLVEEMSAAMQTVQTDEEWLEKISFST